MTKEELEKDYYANRPTEPYSVDDSPNDWANIAHYAEESLEKAFERIVELEATNKKISDECHKLVDSLEKKQEAVSNVIECFVGASSGDDLEMAESAREVMEVLTIPCYRHGEVKSKFTEAKEIMNIAIEGIKHWGIVAGKERPFEKQAGMLFNLFLDKAEQFLNSEVEK